jgi:hypothetical protein
MENMTACSQWVEALHSRAQAQADALKCLAKVFAEKAKHLLRRDQAECLDELRARVAHEVEELQQLEADESYSFTSTKLISGLGKFTVGSVVAAVRGTRKHPIYIGAKLAADELARTKPFGTVVVAVGPGGVPNEVNAISLSWYARKLGQSESQVAAAIQGRCYHVMMPEPFFTALDKLKDKVLEGAASLPVAHAGLLLKSASGE